MREEGYVCTLVINRPERRNAFTADTFTQLGDALNGIRDGGKCRVVVIRGMGEKAFSAGADLMNMTAAGPVAAEKALEYCLDTLINFPLPVIAMIYGYVMGAGLDVAMISDFRLAADNARFGANLVRMGLMYYPAAIQRLVDLVGVAAAKEILIGGRIIDASRAKRIGLVNAVYPVEGLAEATYALAGEIAWESGPLAVKGTKAAIRGIMARRSSLPAELEEDLNAIFEQIKISKDALEGPVAFLYKKKPNFIGQ